MGALSKLRVLIALAAAALWLLSAALGGARVDPPRIADALMAANLMRLPSLDLLDALRLASSTLFLATGLLSFASPSGIIFSIVFSAAALAFTSLYDPRIIGEAAVTGALAGALASDAVRLVKELGRASRPGRSRRRGAPAPGRLEAPAPTRSGSFFPVGPLRIPRVIRGFRVVEYLGRGGHVAVYKVRDNGSVYVMKIPLSSDKAASVWREVEIMKALSRSSMPVESLRRVLAECGVDDSTVEILASRLGRHFTNVLRLVSVNEEAWRKAAQAGVQDPLDPPFIIVEYADKGDASGIAGSSRVNARLIEEIVGAAALFYITTGMVHRDLKLENILLASSDNGVRPILADFATAIRPGRMVGWSPGTPSYMPPEGLFYRDVNVSPAYDVYSLGVLLYKLITGEFPLRQYYFIAVSRHPRISDDIRQEALRVVRMFEFTHLGTSGVILKRIRDIVYPPRHDRGEDWRDEALRRLSDYLKSDPAGASIVSREKEILQVGLGGLGLPAALLNVILDAIDPYPARRPANAACLYARIVEALEEQER